MNLITLFNSDTDSGFRSYLSRSKKTFLKIVFIPTLSGTNGTSCSKAVKLVSDKMITEASGGITESNIVDYAKTGVDYISSGALTNSVRSLDLSLKIVK